MNRQNALRLLEETLGMPSNTLTGGERLSELELWDSLSTMAFIAMADKQFGLPLPGNRVVRCQTVEELLGLLSPRLTDRAA